MTPRTRKYLDIKGTTAAAPAAGSQPSSRPTSSQSTRSTQSESRALTTSKSSSSTSVTGPQRPTKHVRSVSTSHTTAEPAPPRRPLRAPTPEVAPVAAASSHDNGPRRPLVREEPRRLKVNMPPPDFIPTHANTGPQRPERPMSATELHFSHQAPSGPQRPLRLDLTQAGSSNAARTGPIRPFMFMPTSTEDGNGGEKKERVVGGARRVLRVPEPEPAPPTEEKGKAPAAGSKPLIRPRVISTSRSTPALPLQATVAAVKDEHARVKKLASSLGASSRGAAAGAPAAKPGRTASTTQATASSRARMADKPQEKAAEKDAERRARLQAREERAKEKERVHAKQQEQEKEKAKDTEREKERERRPSSRTAAAAPVAASRHAPAATITMRDKTNRLSSKASSKTATKEPKEARKASSKVRASPDVPEVVEVVSPAEVPLPETPKVSPVQLPAQEASPPALICLDTPDNSLLVPVPEVAPLPAQGVPQPAPIPVFKPLSPEQVAAPAPIPVFKPLSPTIVPLPSSRPGSSDGAPTPPPSSGLAPPAPAPTLNLAEPHTPTPVHRPQRRGAEVEQTPISALVASIERGFLAMHRGTGLETMAEMDEEESMLVVGDAGGDLTEMFPPVPAVEPLFSRSSVHA